MDWQEARSLADLAELTAAWLEGGGTEPPGGLTAAIGPDNPVSSRLAAFSRAGLVCTFAQAASPAPAARRAVVQGFCRETTAHRLMRLGVETDLIVLAREPAGHLSVAVPVALGSEGPSSGQSGTAALWASPEPGAEDVETFVGAFPDERAIDRAYFLDHHPDLVSDLLTCWQVAVIDAAWGREDLLWAQVAARLSPVVGQPA